jgi:uncharacterized protein (TIGR03437 family)
MRLPQVMAAQLVVVCGSSVMAQECPVTSDVATYPTTPLTYPMTSNRYAVQYMVNGGSFTDAKVYVSYYGGTNSSPYIKASNYPADTSMSFASIPVTAGAPVVLRVTKIFGSAFPAIGHVSVRPSAKGIHVDSVSGSVVQLSTTTAANFAGDQFVLWWDGNAQESSAIQGLALFLDPPYSRPAGSNVKIVASAADLSADLSSYDTLDFEGTIAVGSTGNLAFIVPANINNIFLAPGAWLQGKLRVTQSGAGHVRRIYGTGVLDVSRFGYMWRQCRNSPTHTDDGYQSFSRIPLTGGGTVADQFVVDGMTIVDSDYYATDYLNSTTINNTKLIGWNGNNDGFQFGVTSRASNVFVRTGDDSLKMWGSYTTVTNATVWQNWNGGVVNLGWSNNSPGDDCLIDGLYVVKMDWRVPTVQSWTATTLSGNNNAVVASLMIPGTKFGTLLPSVYRNIYVDDPPNVLFSLKILPPDCALVGLVSCPVYDPADPGVLNLNLENIFSPVSTVENSIGYQNVNGTNLTGTLNIGMTNVMLTSANGTVTALSSANAATVGKIAMNGNTINLTYNVTPQATAAPQVSSGAVVNGASFAAGAAVAAGSIATVFGTGFGSSESGVTVLVGGVVAPLIAVSPLQISFQVPWQVAGQTQAAVTVTSGGLTSAPIMVPIAPVAPGIFLANTSGQAAALVANTAIVAAPSGTFPGARPVQIGESISIFCTGLGAVTREPATGALAGSNPLSMTSARPIAVSIGGVNAPVSFSGLAPGFFGLYQVNAQVPAGAPVGAAVQLVVTIGGTASNQATIAVGAAGQ